MLEWVYTLLRVFSPKDQTISLPWISGSCFAINFHLGSHTWPPNYHLYPLRLLGLKLHQACSESSQAFLQIAGASLMLQSRGLFPLLALECSWWGQIPGNLDLYGKRLVMRDSLSTLKPIFSHRCSSMTTTLLSQGPRVRWCLNAWFFL